MLEAIEAIRARRPALVEAGIPPAIVALLSTDEVAIIQQALDAAEKRGAENMRNTAMSYEEELRYVQDKAEHWQEHADTAEDVLAEILDSVNEKLAIRAIGD